ncbi:MULTISPECIES: hypothetical protein [unclassified Brevundimonas]|nr:MULTISPECIES: hypothetical protein [unclassified Brevundimonas]
MRRSALSRSQLCCGAAVIAVFATTAARAQTAAARMHVDVLLA